VRKPKRESDYRSFFFEVVPVPPTRFRPASKLGDSVFENPANVHLTNILKANMRVVESRETPDGVPATEKGDGAVARRSANGRLRQALHANTAASW